MDKKVYNSIVSGNKDNSISFSDFQNLIIDLGFVFKRQSGSHLIYYNVKIKERLNIQRDGNKAKGYQVNQLRIIILKHGL